MVEIENSYKKQSAPFKTKIFELWKKFKTKRETNTEKNNRKRFKESLETLFIILLLKKAEQLICGDRLRIEKAEKENVAFLHDQRNARKMKMSTLDHVLREKLQKKVTVLKLRVSKYYKPYLAKQISLPLTQLICKTTPFILNLKPQGKNSGSVQANAFMLLTKPYPCNFQKNIAI